MRIWLAASISPFSYGGIHRSMNQLGDEFKRYGHIVEIVYAPPHREHHRLRFSFALALRLLLLFWKRPHWIIARSSDGLMSAQLARMLAMKTKVALHNHGWEERVAALEHRLPGGLITNPTTWRGRLIGFMLLRHTLKIASLCICGTIDEAGWIRKKYPRFRGKTAVIPNGILPVKEPFWPDRSERPPSFLLVGGFTWKKNLEYGVELFRRLHETIPAARLFIVGCGPLSDRKKQLLFPLGDSVFIVESETPQMMIRWYESCPMLLFPSRYEGGRPFTILEAQSRGCIVFASDLPAIRECITPGVNGFILSCVNPVADAATIESIYHNNDLMRRIGTSAWKKAMRNTVQRQGKRCLRVLLERMAGGGAGKRLSS